MATNPDDIGGGGFTPPPPPEYGQPYDPSVGPYFDPQGQPYVPLPGQDPGEFNAPQIGDTTVAPPPPISSPGGLYEAGLPGVGVDVSFFGSGPAFAPFGRRRRISDRELARLLGERGPTIGLGIFNPFRRQTRMAPAERALRGAVRSGVRELFRIGGRVVSRVRTGPAEPDLIVGERTPIERQLTGPPGSVRNPRGLFRRALTRILGAPFSLGGVVGIGIEAMFPSQLGSGELPPGPLPPIFPGVLESNRRYRIERNRARELERIQREEFHLPRDSITLPPQRDRSVDPGAPPAERRGLLDRVLEMGGIPRSMDDIYRGIEERIRENARSGAGAPAPAPAPVPQVTVAGAPRGAVPRARGPRIGLGIGAIATGLVLERIGRSGSRTGPEPGATFQPVETSAPVAPLPTTALTPFNTVSVGSAFAGGGAADCNCAPRGPRRKCLQRAPVKWSGGPRRGKAAGSKCIRFAARRTR